MIEVRMPLTPRLQRQIERAQAGQGLDVPKLYLTYIMPQRCVYCGEPSEGNLFTDATICGQEVGCAVPYCRKHLDQAHRIDGTINNPFRMSCLLIALYAILVAILYSTSKNLDLVTVVLIGALGFGIGFPLLAGCVIKPLVGLFCKPVRHTPNGGMLGIRVRYLRRSEQVSITFCSEDYARAFVEANRL